MKLIDLTGKRFGELTVLGYLGRSKWKCICDCGKETIVFSCNLTRNHTTSCGCKKGTGIIGKQFGELTVESQIENTNKYICICSCGKKEIRLYTSLVQGATTMCNECSKGVRADALKEKVFIDGTQPSQIALDKSPTKANKSGVVGVNWDKSRGKWQAGITFKGHRYNLGRFEYIQDAIDARKAAEKQIFGGFLEWYEKYKEEQRRNQNDL